MPGLVAPFTHITITELHPTFGAEISGVDFSRPVEKDVFQEILAAISKVRIPLSCSRIPLTQ
jgi:alpha-ketoglutarate-dependent 2,4-dichlorophenoxyacetate dioxygenase